MRNCHASSIHSLHFLPNQPVLMSAGGDNAIKQWIFDQQDGSGRLLRSRSGHSEPPTRIRFYGEDGDLLLSAGQDKTMRLLALRRDEQSVELSQGMFSIIFAHSVYFDVDLIQHLFVCCFWPFRFVAKTSDQDRSDGRRTESAARH
jgi:WD40 repeat protein